MRPASARQASRWLCAFSICVCARKAARLRPDPCPVVGLLSYSPCGPCRVLFRDEPRKTPCMAQADRLAAETCAKQSVMTLAEHAALSSSDACTLYRRLASLEREEAPIDREAAEDAARRIWEQVSELIVQLDNDRTP
jgi:hypothetical protein